MATSRALARTFLRICSERSSRTVLRRCASLQSRPADTYPVFHSQIDALLADRKARKDRLSLVRVCPQCEREQEHSGAECIFCHSSLKGARHAV